MRWRARLTVLFRTAIGCGGAPVWPRLHQVQSFGRNVACETRTCALAWRKGRTDLGAGNGSNGSMAPQVSKVLRVGSASADLIHI